MYKTSDVSNGGLPTVVADDGTVVRRVSFSILVSQLQCSRCSATCSRCRLDRLLKLCGYSAYRRTSQLAPGCLRGPVAPLPAPGRGSRRYRLETYSGSIGKRGNGILSIYCNHQQRSCGRLCRGDTRYRGLFLREAIDSALLGSTWRAPGVSTSM